ncbi:S8 family serine peptidase [Carbonactinospora thermoautotrophica]|uniref:S8 family serine peptidase n=1 Tax=Carbonactinospora thermoautotrophica TaxID=1469144 RepID=UPI003558962B
MSCCRTPSGRSSGNAATPKLRSSSSPSEFGGYDTDDGTSYATAYVSATVALIRAKFPELPANQVADQDRRRLRAAGQGQVLRLRDDQPGPHTHQGRRRLAQGQEPPRTRPDRCPAHAAAAG